MIELEMTRNGPRAVTRQRCKHAWYCGGSFCLCGVDRDVCNCVPDSTSFTLLSPCHCPGRMEIELTEDVETNFVYDIGKTFCLLAGAHAFCFFDFPVSYVVEREKYDISFIDNQGSTPFFGACEKIMEMAHKGAGGPGGFEEALSRLASAMLSGSFEMTEEERIFLSSTMLVYDGFPFFVPDDALK